MPVKVRNHPPTGKQKASLQRVYHNPNQLSTPMTKAPVMMIFASATP